jgi:hypothetical protein
MQVPATAEAGRAPALQINEEGQDVSLNETFHVDDSSDQKLSRTSASGPNTGNEKSTIDKRGHTFP